MASNNELEKAFDATSLVKRLHVTTMWELEHELRGLNVHSNQIHDLYPHKNDTFVSRNVNNAR